MMLKLGKSIGPYDKSYKLKRRGKRAGCPEALRQHGDMVYFTVINSNPMHKVDVQVESKRSFQDGANNFQTHLALPTTETTESTTTSEKERFPTVQSGTPNDAETKQKKIDARNLLLQKLTDDLDQFHTKLKAQKSVNRCVLKGQINIINENIAKHFKPYIRDNKNFKEWLKSNELDSVRTAAKKITNLLKALEAIADTPTSTTLAVPLNNHDYIEFSPTIKSGDKVIASLPKPYIYHNRRGFKIDFQYWNFC